MRVVGLVCVVHGAVTLSGLHGVHRLVRMGSLAGFRRRARRLLVLGVRSRGSGGAGFPGQDVGVPAPPRPNAPTAVQRVHAYVKEAVIAGDFAVVGNDVFEVTVEVLDRILSPGGEMVTVVLGEGGADGVEEHLTEHLRQARPDVDLVVYDGGQENYPLFIAVE